MALHWRFIGVARHRVGGGHIGQLRVQHISLVRFLEWLRKDHPLSQTAKGDAIQLAAGFAQNFDGAPEADTAAGEGIGQDNGAHTFGVMHRQILGDR